MHPREELSPESMAIAKPNIDEAEKQQEQEIAEGYVEYLIEQSVKINEGREGIICQVDLSELDENIARMIRERSGLTPDGDLALKMLKIYPKESHQGAKIIEEGRIQQRARALLEQQGNQEELCAVPKVYFCGEMAVHNPSVLEKLKADGINVSDDNQVEVLFMDFLPGEDLATYMYHEVARRHPKLTDLKQRIDNKERIPFAELMERVQAALEFNVPANRLDPFQERKVENENHKKMTDFLYKSDFVLDKSFLAAIKNSVSVFKDDGLHHRDLHERNVMGDVTEDNRLINPQIIDFGKSQIVPPDSKFVDNSQYLDDRYLQNAYRRLTMTVAERQAEEKMGVFNASRAIIERRHSGEYEVIMSQVENLLSNGRSAEEVFPEIDKAVDGYIINTARLRPTMANTQEAFWNLKALILHELSLRHSELDGQIGLFIDNARVPLSIKNTLKKIKPGPKNT